MKMRALFTGVVLCLAASNARAQTAPTANESLAESQFNEGRKLMEAGRASEACPKFENSQRLDPALGTLLNLADCYERVGLLASARQRFLEAAQTAARDGYPEAEEGARERASRLEPRLARVAISAIRPAPGLSVTCDGRAVDPAQWSTGVAVDPGSHTIEARAPGRQPFQTTLVVDAGAAVKTLTVPELAAAAAPAGSAPVVQAYGSGSPNRSSGLGPTRTAALVAGGVGLVGVVVGTVFGLKSVRKHNEADDHCDGRICRDQAGVDLKSDAIHAGNVSTVAFVLGGVGLAAGVTLTLLGRADSTRPSVGLRVTPVAALLDGRF
jgi:hypothetical protein